MQAMNWWRQRVYFEFLEKLHFRHFRSLRRPQVTKWTYSIAKQLEIKLIIMTINYQNLRDVLYLRKILWRKNTDIRISAFDALWMHNLYRIHSVLLNVTLKWTPTCTHDICIIKNVSLRIEHKLYFIDASEGKVSKS